MSKIIGMMLVRNEADRYLRRVLEGMKTVCDKIIILDDDSTDNTPDICYEYTGHVFFSDKSYWGTNELHQRQLLWELANGSADSGDWFLNLDADETIFDIHKLRDIVDKADSMGHDGISFNLYDMWSETHYRDDSLWNAHSREWIMCIKHDDHIDYKWNEMPLHCGRFPLNVGFKCMPSRLKLQHWGWAKEEDRVKKYARYMAIDPEGKHGILEQYKSIIDVNPNLKEFVL